VLGTVLTIGASLLGLAAQVPDRPTPRFNAGVDLVRLDVSVLDRHRVPVVGLTREDFTVIEDGQPRPIQSFVEVHVPGPARADAPWTAQVPSDVASNTRVDEGGRLVVIVMDRSIPPGNSVMVARSVAASIVNALGPNDLAAVVSTSQPVAQNFTSDHALLLRALARPDWSTDISNEAHEIVQALSAAGGLTPLSVMADGRCHCGRCVPDTIARVADSLAAADRRPKLLFFVGSNLLLQPPRLTTIRRRAAPDEVVDKLGCDVQLKDARTRMFDALTRAHVTVHSLDPSGLTPVGPAVSAASTATGARVNPALASAIEAQQQQLDNLRILPDFTGGRAIVNTNTPQDRVPAIVSESASYYVLGFTPADEAASRTVRSIDVTVNRPDVRVNAPKRYSLSDASPRAIRTSETTTPRDAADAAAIPATLEDAWTSAPWHHRPRLQPQPPPTCRSRSSPAPTISSASPKPRRASHSMCRGRLPRPVRVASKRCLVWICRPATTRFASRLPQKAPARRASSRTSRCWTTGTRRSRCRRSSSAHPRARRRCRPGFSRTSCPSRRRPRDALLEGAAWMPSCRSTKARLDRTRCNPSASACGSWARAASSHAIRRSPCPRPRSARIARQIFASHCRSRISELARTTC
jgi:VWFA-related protein